MVSSTSGHPILPGIPDTLRGRNASIVQCSHIGRPCCFLCLYSSFLLPVQLEILGYIKGLVHIGC